MIIFSALVETAFSQTHDNPIIEQYAQTTFFGDSDISEKFEELDDEAKSSIDAWNA